MKKYLSLFMMFAMLFATSSIFISCGGDDDDNSSKIGGDSQEGTSGIVGFWKVTEITQSEGVESNLHVGDILYVYQDGTFKTQSQSGTWALNGNNFLVSPKDAIPFTYTVTKLTETELVLDIETEYSYQVYGETYKEVYKASYNFVRLQYNNNNESKSGLVGKWIVVDDYSITDFGKKLEHEPGAIWIFTDKTLTIYDEGDIYSGKAVEYTYSNDKIYSSGFPVRNVESLTSTKMVLTWKTFVDYDQTVTLVREN